MMTPESYLDAMTVNERLFTLGLLEAFDRALAARDRDRLIMLLRRAQLSDKQAGETADAVLARQ